MKRILSYPIVLLIFLLGLGSRQVIAQPAPRSQWVQRVGSPTVLEYVHNTLKLSANRYVSAGVADANNGRLQRAYLAFTDSLGAVLAERTYSIAGYDQTDISAVSGLAHGQFYAAGYGFPLATGHHPVMFLTKYDSLGTILWQREYQHTDPPDTLFRQDFDIVATPDGGFTSAYKDLPAFWRAEVTRFDARGRMRWARGLGTYSHAYRMAALPDGSYAVASTDYTRVIQPSYHYNDGEIKLYKISPAGDSLTSVWLDSPGYYDIPFQLSPTSDGGLLLVGYQEANPNSTQIRGFCIKLDSLWHEQWHHYITGYISQAQELANGHVLIAAAIRSPPFYLAELISPTHATPADSLPTIAWELHNVEVDGLTMFCEPNGSVRLFGDITGTVARDVDLGIQYFTGLTSPPVNVDMCAHPPQLTQAPTFGPLVGNTLSFALDSTTTLAGPRYGEVSLVTWDFGDGTPADTGWTASHAFASPQPVRVRVCATNNLFCQTCAELYPFGPVGTAPETAAPQVHVYPNPSAGGVFTVKASPHASPLKERGAFAVLDAVGRVISSGFLTGEETRLDLRAQPAGVYALRLTWPGRPGVTRRLVK